jgi:hypothetical protein
MSARLLSLIVPVYFEEECIERFLAETTAVLTKLETEGLRSEIEPCRCCSRRRHRTNA